jgi:AcrR family transcriptional regulator
MRTAGGDGRQARGKPRERAILSAVISLLGETGYEAMTMDAVAARAHASKTTIYRRWPGKAELVRAAVDAHITSRVLGTQDSGTQDTGSLRGDLLAVMNAMPGHLTPEFMAMMSGLVHALRTDPQLAASLRSLFDHDSVAEQIVGRAARRGELPAPAASRLAGLVHEVVEAQIFRQLMTASAFDGSFAAHVVDDIILPLLAGRTAAGNNTE